ncbi:branched-chain amino acid ABC transporter permease [Segnochrobactraceae bacterium EtOH-i3]
MSTQIALLLGQDGIINGAIYALLALSILLVFSVTRIMFIPQGEFVSFSALTMAAMQTGRPVYAGFLVLGLAAVGLVMDLAEDRSRGGWRATRSGLGFLVYALAITAFTWAVPMKGAGQLAQIALTLLLIVPMGPLFYRVFFQPIAAQSPLVLLIVAIAVHVALVGVGLLMFGAEGGRTEPFSSAMFRLGPAIIRSQTLWVIGLSIVAIVALALFFGRTLYGKALRATAIDRMGAELMGISPNFAGKLTLGLAALIGALSGILIAPITTFYYDTGFIIGLKGFVGAVMGGLVSYPLAAIGSLIIGQVESFSTFWASTYKEVIVFTLILPVLLYLSLSHKTKEDSE